MSSDRTYISFCAWVVKNNLIFIILHILSEKKFCVVMHILISTEHDCVSVEKLEKGNRQ